LFIQSTATHRIGLYLDDLRVLDDAGRGAHFRLLAHSGPANVAELHRGLAHKRPDQHSTPASAATTRAVGEQTAATFVVRPTAKDNGAARPESFICFDVVARRERRRYQGFQEGCRGSEQEAHERVGFTRTRATRKRKKALVKPDGLKRSV
jgi:hypothetical protein